MNKPPKTYDIPEHKCTCGASLNASYHSGGKEVLPKENDVTFCAYCAKIWVFDKNLVHREPTEQELETFSNCKNINRARVKLKMIHGLYKKNNYE